nr:MAG TPA: hypothetical protein [Caudoviricetes sp.]
MLSQGGNPRALRQKIKNILTDFRRISNGK